MSRKIFIPITVAFVVAIFAGLWVSTEALAQDGGLLSRLRRARATLGQVTAVSEDQFTIEKKNDEEQNFLVDENTRFTNRERETLSIDDLEIGQWVTVAAPKASQEDPVARLVVLLPEDLDPSEMTGFRGSITGVNVGGNQFTLQTRKGEQTTFKVDSSTIFKGEATALSGLQEGMSASVAAKQLEGSSLLAEIVRSGYPIAKHQGEITKVDQTASILTLRTLRDKQELTFKVDENTRFRSKDSSIQSLKDVKVGMMGVVVSREQKEGIPVAVMVGAANKEDLPKFDQRIGGRIVSLDENTFSIKGRNGEEYTFQVTEDTCFRSRKGQVSGLEDLEVGMAVMVGANELGNGEYQAQLVIAFPGFNPGIKGQPGQQF